jgi:hypothetical protein
MCLSGGWFPLRAVQVFVARNLELGEAAVDKKLRANHEGGIVGYQKQRRPRNLIGVAQTLQPIASLHPLVSLFDLGLRLSILPEYGRIDRAWTDVRVWRQKMGPVRVVKKFGKVHIPGEQNLELDLDIPQLHYLAASREHRRRERGYAGTEIQDEILIPSLYSLVQCCKVK